MTCDQHDWCTLNTVDYHARVDSRDRKIAYVRCLKCRAIGFTRPGYRGRTSKLWSRVVYTWDQRVSLQTSDK